MHFSTWLTFLAATIVVMIAPGPSVALIVANSLRHGRRAGLSNVAGFQLGFAIMIDAHLLGLASLIAAMGEWFIWVRLPAPPISSGSASNSSWAARTPRPALRERRAAASSPRPSGGRGQQSQGAALLRRLLPTIHRSGRQRRPPDPHHGRDVDGGRRDHRHDLCAHAARLANGLSKGRVRAMRWASGSLLIGGGLWLAVKGE